MTSSGLNPFLSTLRVVSVARGRQVRVVGVGGGRRVADMDRTVVGRIGRRVVVGGAVVVAVAGFLPWLRSGQVVRDSFQVVRVADHLDLADGVGQQVAIGLWYVLPALCALTVLAAVIHRLTAMAVLGVLVGVVAVAAAGLTIRAPFPSEAGPWVALLAGAVTVVASALSWWARPRGVAP
jgi:hypothetical protein